MYILSQIPQEPNSKIRKGFQFAESDQKNSQMWLTKKIPGNAVKRMELLSLDHHEVQCECVNLVTLGARLIHHAGQPEARYE